MQNRPVIIPVASGKGGVGKSFLCANLAVALADLGNRTIAVDLDMGGSNLYGFLGMKNKYPGIGEFIHTRLDSLEDLVVPTDIDNLGFLPGDGKSLFMANISFNQKAKLLRHLRKLDAEYVLLDLSGGSSFNTLDFFGCVNNGILVVTPEYNSIMNMLVFLKNFIFRIIGKELSKNHSVMQEIKQKIKDPQQSRITTVAALVEEVGRLSQEMAESIVRLCSSIRPRIVINQAQHADDLKRSKQIDRSAKEILNLEPDYFGIIYNDSQVGMAARNTQPFLRIYPDSNAARGVLNTAERIMRYWHKPVKNSASLLYRKIQADKSSFSYSQNASGKGSA